MTAPAAVSLALRKRGPAIVFTAMALGELIADKLPGIPSRKSPGPFAWRVVVGGFCGRALCAAAGESQAVGFVLGALGGVAGTLGGYEARTRLVRALEVPDYVVALAEDAVAVGGSAWMVSL